MRVCIVGPSKRFFSGITNQTVFLANALSKHNEVSVILLRNLLPRFLFPGKDHIGKDQYVVDLSPNIKVYDGMDYNSPLSWIGAHKFLKKHKPDVIVMLWWTSSVAHMQIILNIMNRWDIKAKTVLEMHEIVDPLEESILPLRIYSRLSGRWLVRGANICTAKSEFNKTQISRIYGISENKIFVVPHGLYENFERALDKSQSKKELGIQDEFVILYFGLIRRYKGVPHLIKAFDSLTLDVARHSRLLIVGEVWEENEILYQMISGSKYKDRITLDARYIADDLIPKYFSASDVVVLPYLRSAGSGVAHLAMTFGKPIILSDVPALRESLGNYSGSIFVEPGNPVPIRDNITAVHKAMESGDDLHYSSTHTTWDDIACQYETIIEQLVSEREMTK